MAKNRLQKTFGIDHAYVCFAATGEGWIHPLLTLKTADDSSVTAIKFQAHRLDRPDGLGNPVCLSKDTQPDPRFDFGYPYSACYGGRFEEVSSYSFGSLRAEPNGGGSGLKKLGQFADRIRATIQEYNLALVAPNCQLALWVAALEKLGVPVHVAKYVGRGGEEIRTCDLPDDQRAPARKLFEADRNGAYSEVL